MYRYETYGDLWDIYIYIYIHLYTDVERYTHLFFGKRLFKNDPPTRQVHAWASGTHPTAATGFFPQLVNDPAMVFQPAVFLQVIQQERLVHHTVEQLVEVPVQIPQEKIVQVPKIAVQERSDWMVWDDHEDP